MLCAGMFPRKERLRYSARSGGTTDSRAAATLRTAEDRASGEGRLGQIDRRVLPWRMRDVDGGVSGGTGLAMIHSLRAACEFRRALRTVLAR